MIATTAAGNAGDGEKKNPTFSPFTLIKFGGAGHLKTMENKRKKDKQKSVPAVNMIEARPNGWSSNFIDLMFRFIFKKTMICNFVMLYFNNIS